jgi:RNA polymerase sigma-70 factor (ECF subfamily)
MFASAAQPPRAAGRPHGVHSTDGSKAFARLYDESVSRVYGYLGYRVNSAQEAEVLTRRTFELAQADWASFDARQASAIVWLLRIARRVAQESLGEDRGPTPAGSSAEAPIGGHGQAGSESECPQHPHRRVSNVQAGLNRMSAEERDAVALRFGAELTAAELAEVTGRGTAEVRAVIHRAVPGRDNSPSPQPRL